MRKADVPKSVGRLALDRSLRGRGHGGQLLLDALERAVDASARAAARLVAVDAGDGQAAAFHRRCGFRACSSAPIAVLRELTASSQVPPSWRGQGVAEPAGAPARVGGIHSPARPRSPATWPGAGRRRVASAS
ncbi:MAG: GNAT family N-acetyltransferase [Acidimicrobiales bacterium]